MRAMQTYYPQVYAHQQPGFSPVGSAESSPLHQPHMTNMPYQPMPGQAQMAGPPGMMPQGVPPTGVPQNVIPPGVAGPPEPSGVPYTQAEGMGAPALHHNQPAYVPQNLPPDGMTLPAGYSTNMAQNPGGGVPSVPYSQSEGAQPPNPNYVYNMQGMVGALPGQAAPNVQSYSQPGPPPPNPTGYAEMGTQQYGGQQPAVLPGQPGMAQPANTQQPPPDNKSGPQLISFD